ncbi:MAG: DUF3108 domain-containing protein [Maricaulaceae bacterium]|nr:DUF3108 domain-containing protein [Maricaulaceae bacterium]
MRKHLALTLTGVMALAIPAAAPASGGGAHAPASPDRLSVSASYAGTVLAIPVGRVDLHAELSASAYRAESTVQAAGLAALFTDFRIDSEVEGVIEDGRARPVRYAHDERTGRKRRLIEMGFEGGVARSTATPEFSSRGVPPASDADRAGAIDPMTAVLHLSQALARPGAEPCAGRLPVFDGKQRYNLRLEARGTRAVRAGPWRGEAIVCDAFYEPVSGYDPEDWPSERDLRRPLTLWIAPLNGGAAYIPVRAQTRAAFGVVIELRRLELAEV